MSTQREIAIEPIINYPSVAEPGESYLMTVDLRPQLGESGWSYDREEYVINCHVNGGELFSVEPLGDATVIVHRFGGTYGPARFVLTASEREGEENLRVTLINGWGVPLSGLEPLQIRVASHIQNRSYTDLTSTSETQTSDSKSDQQIEIKPNDILGSEQNASNSNVLFRISQFIKKMLPNRAKSDSLHQDYEIFMQMEKDYLQQIYQQFRHLPMRLIDYSSVNAEDDSRVDLADIYVAMNVKGRKVGELRRGRVTQSIEDKPFPVLEAVIKAKQFVLLGDPGGGKSTFVNHLAYCLAAHAIAPRQGMVDRLQTDETLLPTAWMLPVPIILREVAAWIQSARPTEKKTGLFMAYLHYWLDNLGMADFHAQLENHLKSGKGVLLLDGLDEVALQLDEASGIDSLGQIKEMIAALPLAYPETAIVVTCRVLSYQDPRWQLGKDHIDGHQWSSHELAPLTDEQINTFVHAWYDRLANQGQVKHPEVQSSRLLWAVQRPDFQRLVRNPLLLTVMALIHSNKGELPDARVLLYEDVVDLLLVRWEMARFDGKDADKLPWRHLLDEAGLKDSDVKQALWVLAFEIHGQMAAQNGMSTEDVPSESTADIAEADLLDRLRLLHLEKSWDWAAALVEILKMRAGLLVETRPRVYSFPHRTFQEFLAACHLAIQGNFVQTAQELAQQDTFWREVILLASSRLAHEGRLGEPLLLIDELCPSYGPDEYEAHNWRNVWLAGQVLMEVGLQRAQRQRLGKALVIRVRQQLTTLVSDGALDSGLEPRERADAGNVLSRLGDERDFDEMILIPAGEFLMGSAEDDPDAEDHEKPQHRLYLRDYYISKYPVTNEQYAHFVQATNHEPPYHWTGNRPPDELRNHPVVNVTWYDAQAYCAWLSQAQGQEYGLPTEAQWEKAARGTDGRRYPWGDEFDARLCNIDETEIGSTSPVGLFAAGASPYGCMDMAGNVFEWTSSLWGKNFEKPAFGYPYDPNDGREDSNVGDECLRLMRGGSNFMSNNDIRCTYRLGYDPLNRDARSGFRCCFSSSP